MKTNHKNTKNQLNHSAEQLGNSLQKNMGSITKKIGAYLNNRPHKLQTMFYIILGLILFNIIILYSLYGK